MHLDVVPVLRCPRAHEETALVLVADETQGRHVVNGILGCPVCEAEYPIHEGIAYFADRAGIPGGRERDVIRTAAMLGLTEPGGVIMLAGRWASTADALSELAEALVLVVNPPPMASEAERVSVLYAADRLPIAARALRAAAIDTPSDGIAVLLRSKGRLVATNDVPVPPEIAELARDAEYWVGERAEVVPVLPLTRASRWRS